MQIWLGCSRQPKTPVRLDFSGDADVCLMPFHALFVKMESQFKLTDSGVLARYFVTIKSRRKELVSQELRLLPPDAALSFGSAIMVWFAFELLK